MARKILIAILPVLTGGFIYLTYRTDDLILFDWFNWIGLSGNVEQLRTNRFLQSLTIPNWVKFNLPDALWMFSLNYVVLALWNFSVNRQSAFWLLLTPTVGFAYEIGQLVGLVPGTFDIVDLFLLLIASLLPLLFVTNLKTIKIHFLWPSNK